MKKQRGFTLIEILIVVVILAVLATLILPRMLAQPEAALVAEANQELGSLARAQQNYMQLNGSVMTAGMAFTAPGTATEWGSMGLQPPPAGSRFEYGCTATTCTATRLAPGSGTIIINYTATPISFSCTSPYKPLSDPSRGCTLAS